MKLLALLWAWLPALASQTATLEGELFITAPEGRTLALEWQLAATPERLQIVLYHPAFTAPVAALEERPEHFGLWWQAPGRRKASRYSEVALPTDWVARLEHAASAHENARASVRSGGLPLGKGEIAQTVHTEIPSPCGGNVRLHWQIQRVTEGRAVWRPLPDGPTQPLSALAQLPAWAALHSGELPCP